MAKQTTPKRGITPPKGRPTRARDASYRQPRVFGAVAQWTAAAILLLLLIAVLIILTDGGDFNPFNDGTSGALADLSRAAVGLAAARTG